MPAMRDAQMMLFYAACTGHLKSSTDEIISRVVSDHHMLTRCRKNFASMMDVLKQGISRRIAMLGKYTLQSMESANTREDRATVMLSALVILLITPNPLCADSPDCSRCIFTCLQRLQCHRNTMMAMIRTVSLHMVTLRRILDSSMSPKEVNDYATNTINTNSNS
jgi:hypothetical protein